MKEVDIYNPELFLSLLEESLLSAPIVSTTLSAKYDEVNNEVRSKKFSSLKEADSFQNLRIAEFIYQTYDKVIVTSDDMVYGEPSSGERELLFNGTDCKVWMDAIALRLE